MFGNIFNRDTPGQLYHLGKSGLTCELVEPADNLNQHIYYYWLLKINDGEVDLEVIPDAALDLVLSPHLPGFSCVYLPTTKIFTIPLKGPVIYAGVSFQTQSALTLFSTSLEQLQELEQGMATTDALNIISLVNKIQHINTLEAIRAEFNQFFSGTLAAKDTPHTNLILKDIINYLDPASVKEIAHRTGMSERQFRRTTSNLTGLSPKQLQRVMRLQSTLHAFFDKKETAELDAFYDDSHKIKEIKRLTGLTPGQIQRLAEKYNR